LTKDRLYFNHKLRIRLFWIATVLYVTGVIICITNASFWIRLTGILLAIPYMDFNISVVLKETKEKF